MAVKEERVWGLVGRVGGEIFGGMGKRIGEGVRG